MGEAYQIAEPDFGATDEIGYSFGQAGAFREDIVTRGFEAERLADSRPHPPAGALQFPIDAPGDAAAILDPVISGEAVEREQVGIFKIDCARIFIGNIEIADLGAGDDLDARLEHLRAAERFAHEGPFDVERRCGDAARGPAFGAAVAGGGGRDAVVGVVDIAAHQRGQSDDLPQASQPLQIPLRPGKSALGVLPVIAQQREAVCLKLHIAAQHRVGELLAEIDRGQR